MKQKVVLITGASSGIGKAIGVHLSNKDYIVYGTCRDHTKYLGFTQFPLLSLDVKKPEQIKEGVQKILKEQGQIDILINNAGVGITGPVEETPEQDIQQGFDTNLFGPIRMIKAVLPEMRKHRSGLIINITSIAGYMGLPYRGIYSATKGALELTTEALRMELKEFNIQLTNVAPGDFATNIAAGRFHVPYAEESPYAKSYGQTLAMMDDHVDTGGDPMEVARLIEQIITTKQVKIHYKVGAFLQKFSIVLKRILPDRLYEKMLLNHYKL